MWSGVISEKLCNAPSAPIKRAMGVRNAGTFRSFRIQNMLIAISPLKKSISKSDCGGMNNRRTPKRKLMHSIAAE